MIGQDNRPPDVWIRRAVPRVCHSSSTQVFLWLYSQLGSLYHLICVPINPASPTEKKGAEDRADHHIPDCFSLFDDICFASLGRPPTGSSRGKGNG